MARACLLDRYATRLPVTPRTPRLTLGEGGTAVAYLAKRYGQDGEWPAVKYKLLQRLARGPSEAVSRVRS